MKKEIVPAFVVVLYLKLGAHLAFYLYWHIGRLKKFLEK
jgi:hypothetical protein|tara:strand:- start:1874 stop:1990 length:117 start_codon:yes stop_codon:yes gene_type:complete